MKEKILLGIQKVFFPLELVALILISLKFFLEGDNQITTGVGFILLAALYFFTAYFSPQPGMTRFASFSKKILGVALSVSVIGIYFTFMHLPGAQTMLTIGVTSIIISMIFLLIEILRKSETANLVKFSVIRGLVISICSALLLYFADFNA